MSKGNPIPLSTRLTIGGLIYPNMDQCDFTGPFEALARVPNSHFMTIWKDKNPVRDLAGMLLMADTTMAEAPQLDVLLVPGGHGQEALMHDEAVLSPFESRRQTRDLFFQFAPAHCFAAPPAYYKANAQPRIGRRWKLFPILVRYPVMNVSSLMESSSVPVA